MQRFTLLLLLPCLISATMWDNLYDGQGVPFQLPFNFSMLLSPTGFSRLIKYSIHTNTDENGLSINTTSPIASNQTVLSQLKFNFTTGTMIAYSEQRGCVIVRNKSMIYNDFYSALEGMLELALLLNSADPVGIYKKVDVTQLLNLMNVTGCVSNLALYFINDWTLHFVESTFRNGNKSSVTVHNIAQNLTGLNEFEPQPQWQCEKMKIVQIDGEDYVVPDDGNDDDNEEIKDYDDEDSDVENKKMALKAETLEDLIMDYLLPVNLDKEDRNAIHNYMEQMFLNYVGCNNKEWSL